MYNRSALERVYEKVEHKTVNEFNAHVTSRVANLVQETAPMIRHHDISLGNLSSRCAC